jgi:multidrug efflux pump subunit AcrA (membrane-fusion protein)
MKKICAAGIPLLFAAALWGCGGGTGSDAVVQEEEKLVVVDVEEAAPVRMEDRLQLPGKIEAYKDVTVSAEVGGILESLFVDEGVAVARGEKMAVIDRENLEIKERQAELSVEQAAIRSQQAAIAVTQAEAALAQSSEQLRKAAAVRKEAEADRERGIALYEEQLAPRSRLDELEMAFEAASADLASAEIGVRSAEAGLEAARENLQASKSLEKTAQAQIDEVRLALRKCIIHSPIDGYVDLVHSEEGEFVKAQDPLVRIVQTRPAKAVFHLPESDVPYMNEGMKARVTVSALGNGDLEGTVALIGVTSDAATSTYRLEVDLPNEDGRLRPGMLASLNIMRRSIDEALSVPVFAVVKEESGTVLYVYRDGAAERREVTTGVVEKDRIHIASGLEAGDLVIVKGQRDLENGQRVKLP